MRGAKPDREIPLDGGMWLKRKRRRQFPTSVAKVKN